MRPLQLDHINLTLRDYGVNLNSKLLYSRRLTCAPLTPEHFIAVESNGEAWLLFAKTNSSLMESGTSPLDRPLSWFGEDGSRMTESGDSPRLRLRLSFPDGRMPHPTDPDEKFRSRGSLGCKPLHRIVKLYLYIYFCISYRKSFISPSISPGVSISFTILEI